VRAPSSWEPLVIVIVRENRKSEELRKMYVLSFTYY